MGMRTRLWLERVGMGGFLEDDIYIYIYTYVAKRSLYGRRVGFRIIHCVALGFSQGFPLLQIIRIYGNPNIIREIGCQSA